MSLQCGPDVTLCACGWIVAGDPTTTAGQEPRDENKLEKRERAAGDRVTMGDAFPLHSRYHRCSRDRGRGAEGGEVERKRTVRPSAKGREPGEEWRRKRRQDEWMERALEGFPAPSGIIG